MSSPSRRRHQPPSSPLRSPARRRKGGKRRKGKGGKGGGAARDMGPSLIDSMQELLDKETRVLELELMAKDKELFIMKEKYEQLQAQNRLDGVGDGATKSATAAGIDPALLDDAGVGVWTTGSSIVGFGAVASSRWRSRRGLLVLFRGNGADPKRGSPISHSVGPVRYGTIAPNTTPGWRFRVPPRTPEPIKLG